MKTKLTLFIVLFLIIGVSFSQVTRIVLFEEGTNASCNPCAANNPILDAFLNANTATTQAIKYHASWPGYDPMYQANPTQNTERIVNYYNMNATGVPYCNCDGIIQDIWPFSTTAFTNAMNQRLAVPSLIAITVTDQRVPGDSVKSTIVLNVVNNLPAGNYKLRVMAIEGVIIYTTPPGSNGESVFKQVFRRAYPNTTGVDIPTTTGTYSYTYTYKRETAWVDTSIYTVAFVQNDVNKEVINSARGHYTATSIGKNNEGIPSGFALYRNYPNPFNPVTTISFDVPKSGIVKLKVYDVLGNMVASLADGVLAAGSYKTEFNGANLASGVYFYKLQTESFSDTKRMMLVK